MKFNLEQKQNILLKHSIFNFKKTAYKWSHLKTMLMRILLLIGILIFVVVGFIIIQKKLHQIDHIQQFIQNKLSINNFSNQSDKKLKRNLANEQPQSDQIIIGIKQMKNNDLLLTKPSFSQMQSRSTSKHPSWVYPQPGKKYKIYSTVSPSICLHNYAWDSPWGQKCTNVEQQQYFFIRVFENQNEELSNVSSFKYKIISAATKQALKVNKNYEKQFIQQTYRFTSKIYSMDELLKNEYIHKIQNKTIQNISNKIINNTNIPINNTNKNSTINNYNPQYQKKLLNDALMKNQQSSEIFQNFNQKNINKSNLNNNQGKNISINLTFNNNNISNSQKNLVDIKQQQQRQKFDADQQLYIWQLKQVNFTASNSFEIYSLAKNISLNGWAVLRYVDHQYFHERLTTWIIKEVKNYTQMAFQSYQDNLAGLIRNITFNINKQIHYQQLVQFLNMRYQYSLIQQNLPLWLIQEDVKSYISNIPQIQSEQFNLKFKTKIKPKCPKNHRIAYIWFGHQQIPFEYKSIIQTCKQKSILLNYKDFLFYVNMWNSKISQQKYKIIPQNLDIRQQINQLKLLYLYFQSGIYADLDQVINQQCFDGIKTDQIIFTNQSNIDEGLFIVPQESFMMVLKKYNPQIKRMLQAQITKHDRWEECRYRQCLVLYCQQHLKDNTWRKGYD